MNKQPIVLDIENMPSGLYLLCNESRGRPYSYDVCSSLTRSRGAVYNVMKILYVQDNCNFAFTSSSATDCRLCM